jgi:hypothetical protein
MILVLISITILIINFSVKTIQNIVFYVKFRK